MYKLRCISCGKLFEPSPSLYTCDKCGQRYGTLEVIYDYEKLNIKKTHFDKCGDISQFKHLLPITNYPVIQKVGNTPVLSFKNFFGIKNVIFKYDGTNPTGSYKDRATTIAIAKAYEYGYNTIYCASTGNAASSLAGLSSTTKLKTYIFVPSNIPPAKLSQLVVYGARVIQIDGNYDTAFEFSIKVGEKLNWYSRNSAINPYLLEGKKTGALELVVQFDFKVPDVVFVSAGDGTVISGIFKGFYDFYKLNIINKIPKIIGVQAEGADSIVKTFENGKPYTPVDIIPHTIADSISVGKPRDVIKACKYVEKSRGKFLRVSDSEIKNAIFELAQKTGIFAEPAGAAAYAGFKKALEYKLLSKENTVAIFITGNGLKDISPIMNNLNIQKVNPNLKEILDFIEVIK
ncbi:threonine synthase [Thermosipho melanesiensis]|uniref:Threonine synthase n=2 Tax=Thermosipho melanesiensis TaxID=46541 RepID=A6LMM2_THEM4|nr:threonine synthase [Thermosipho melanesiensis]ABR31173.1 threonine synthase [Thermosipho melanesiensis BI429]APT74262.1 threonine synthase [Thermosipho melanesiensis]OOC36202.1 threonine synthase [Thermosipho melanesiensis]OOC37020.1 threonine synthase [Thermosipho melanesiensis]OOC37772.1 threonine synthase [Thermosipho melanesiensis]